MPRVYIARRWSQDLAETSVLAFARSQADKLLSKHNLSWGPRACEGGLGWRAAIIRVGDICVSSVPRRWLQVAWRSQVASKVKRGAGQGSTSSCPIKGVRRVRIVVQLACVLPTGKPAAGLRDEKSGGCYNVSSHHLAPLCRLVTERLLEWWYCSRCLMSLLWFCIQTPTSLSYEFQTGREEILPFSRNAKINWKLKKAAVSCSRR